MSFVSFFVLWHFNCNAIFSIICVYNILFFIRLTKDEMEWYRINRNDVRLILKRRIDRPNMEELNLFKDDPIKWLTLRNCLQTANILDIMYAIDSLENCINQFFDFNYAKTAHKFSNWISFNFQLILDNMFDCFWSSAHSLRFCALRSILSILWICQKKKNKNEIIKCDHLNCVSLWPFIQNKNKNYNL